MGDIKRIAILGDIHCRKQFPYFESTKEVFKWVLDNPTINNEETLLIFLGDLYHEDENGGTVNHIIQGLVKDLKNDTKIILEGNHDGSLEDSALEPLSLISGVERITEMSFRTIGGKTFLFLPHIYTDSKGITMEEKYSSIDLTDHIDYCLFHVMTEKVKFSKQSKVCDLSNLDIGQRIGGHNHNFDLDKGGDYLGSVQPNSATEVNKTPKAYIIDLESGKDSTIDIPLFINYYTVAYPNPLPEIDVKYPVLTITESLDKSETTKFYLEEARKQGLDLKISKVMRKKVMNDKEAVENEEGKEYKTDQDYFDTFSKEKALSSGVVSIVQRVLSA